MRLMHSHFHTLKNCPRSRSIKSLQGYGLECSFSFNGKEKIDEITGAENDFDFGARIYDARLGRWLSLDPYKEQFVSHSAYIYCYNNPLRFIDIKGAFPGDVNAIIVVDGGLSNIDYKPVEKIGDWTIIRATSFEAAATLMGATFQNKKIDNMVFSGHGPGGDVPYSMFLTSSLNYFGPTEIKDFNQDKCNTNLHKSDFSALEEIATYLNRNSQVIFTQCGGGNDDEMGKQLSILFAKSTGFNDINIYLSEDNVKYVNYENSLVISRPVFSFNLIDSEKSLSTGYDKYTTFGNNVFKFNVGNINLNMKNPESESIVDLENQSGECNFVGNNEP
jgi:RHS repeat-associated protein